MFYVVLRRRGRLWDAAKPLEEQSGWDEHAAFMDALVDDGFVVRSTLSRDPWSETHLVVDAIEPWTIRLDGRR